MSQHKPLTIVLPCYNPQDNWADNIVEHYRQIAEQIQADVAIVVVNDGSSKGVTDKDVAVLKSGIDKFEYISYSENQGKGYALRKGVAVCNTELVIYTDIDFPYRTGSLLQVYNTLLDDDIDAAIGIKDAAYYNKVPFARKAISQVLRKLIGWFFKLPITDTQCGLKGFKQAGTDLFLTTTINRYLFDLEFIRIAAKNKLVLKEVPVSLKDGVVFSKMNFSILIPELYNFIKLFFRRT